MYPDFIGIGAQKAGTTWLARNLAPHPEIHMPRKEVHYFDRKIRDRSNVVTRMFGKTRSDEQWRRQVKRTPSQMVKNPSLEQLRWNYSYFLRPYDDKWYSKVFEPEVTVTAVVDFTGASQALAATTLRAVIGDIPLDDVLAKREQINNVLRTKLDEVTGRWGVKITNVEIREIVPPRDIQDAMNRQMSAERNRRALITESEGTRQATINVAEGDKQSNILRAEGDRQSQILKAEGYANALQTIFAAASGIDEKTMSLQYLDALKALADGASTKWIVPMELSELTRPITAAMRQTRGVGEGSATG